MSNGLNPLDPGLTLLGRALRGAPPRELLLVFCGDLPGVAPGATRLVLDAGESLDSPHRCLPVALEAPKLAPASFAAVWPRAHLGKDFTLACFGLAALHLNEGGRLLCAVRKTKGAETLASALQQLLGPVTILARHRGYRLLCATRGPGFDLDAARALWLRRYVIRDVRLGDVVLASAPGVFARRELDAGTACLIQHAGSHVTPAPQRVLDLCAGIGPLGIWAARYWCTARVLAVESNYRAAELHRINTESAGVGERVHLMVSSGLGPIDPVGGPDWGRDLQGQFDLALCNPPGHAGPRELRGLLSPLRGWLKPGAPALCVVHRMEPVRRTLEALGACVMPHAYPPYVVMEVRFRGAER
jgi:16S rRNA G1207 methylase RsmC